DHAYPQKAPPRRRCPEQKSEFRRGRERGRHGQSSSFLWRLARAYNDVHDLTDGLVEKEALAQQGKEAGEEAVKLNPSCAESHQWYAIMCGLMADYGPIQSKIKNGFLFKVCRD
ncbi:hypothetical protein NHX12_022593, partial [Muraenolepis orangiensis]